MMGLKQEALADLLGEDWSQKKISYLETREVIEPDLLEALATALKVPAEAIKNFDEMVAINIISNTFNNHDQASPQFANTINNTPTFNALDKYVEAVDEIRRLNEENKKLYEELLKSEREKVVLLERMFLDKKD